MLFYTRTHRPRIHTCTHRTYRHAIVERDGRVTGLPHNSGPEQLETSPATSPHPILWSMLDLTRPPSSSQDNPPPTEPLSPPFNHVWTHTDIHIYEHKYVNTFWYSYSTWYALRRHCTVPEKTPGRWINDNAELSTFGDYVRRIHTQHTHKGKKGASFIAAPISWLNLLPPIIKHPSLKTIKLFCGWKTTNYKQFQ